MKLGKISAVLITAAMPFVSGCTSAQGPDGTPKFTVRTGDYKKADAPIGNDIKGILAQGGLDTSNPSNTAVAQANPAGPKVLSNTATDLQSLVAQLDANSGVSVVGNEPVARPTQVAVAKPQSEPVRELALAEPPKATPSVQTLTFEPIGTPVGDKVSVNAAAVPSVAAVPDVEREVASKPRQERQRKVAQVRKTKRVVEEASTYKKPTVNRF